MVVAVGVGNDIEVMKAVSSVDFEVVTVKSENELVELLLNGEVDAAVRGSLSASEVMSNLRNIYPELYRASCIELNDKRFLLGPVGVVEGSNLFDKLQFALLGSDFLKSHDINPCLAVITSGRPNDPIRNKKINEMIEEGKKLTSKINEQCIEAKHYYALIDEAIQDGANLIIPSDGIFGNMIFRSMVLTAGVTSYGAVTLGMDEIFIDTSRSQKVEGFKRALNFANYLSNLATNKV
jgi:putative methanogen marker protein 4